MIEDYNLLTKLHELYADRSKHSTYQNIPQFIRDTLGYTEKINELWRGDSTRWKYMENHLDLREQNVLDVGANTGFFTLSLAEQYPDSIFTAMEGNANHAEFILMVVQHFSMKNVEVLLRYLDFSTIDLLGKYDTILLYNVLHHAGADFDRDIVRSQKDLFDYLVQFMTKLRRHCKKIVLQMGYNWGGNKRQPIVTLNDDAGKCIYTCRFLREADWEIEAIATSYTCQGAIPVFHKNLPSDVIKSANDINEGPLRRQLGALLDPRINSFSEFYRRPLFICSSE